MSRNRLAEIQSPQNTSAGGNYDAEHGNDFVAGESYEMQRPHGSGRIGQNEFLDEVDHPLSDRN